MPPDLRESLRSFDVPAARVDPGSLWRRARRRALIRRATASAGVLSVALASWLLVPDLIAEDRRAPVDRGLPSVDMSWKDASGAPIVTGGYVFRDLEVRLAPQVAASPPTEYRAVVRGEVSFEDGYPGRRSCTWDVLDGNGTVIGSATSDFTAAGPSSGTLKDRIDVIGTPEEVRVSCLQEPLDDPSVEIVISNVRVHTSESSERVRAFGERAVEVVFDYRWTEGGDPPPQRCLVVVRDHSGATLMEEGTTLVHASREREQGTEFFVLTPPDDIDLEDVGSAEMTCSPAR